MYYLQSRYYDPELGRFINADAFTSTGQGLLGNNMFAYCLNNPVNRSDVTGATSLWIYLIKDHDMGFIHRAVVSHIQHAYNVRTEVRLSGYGRADVVSGSAVWEVKHAGKDPMQRMFIAFAESCGYVLLNDELDTVGAFGAFRGTFYIGCAGSAYRIEYYTPYWGAVLYTVCEESSYNGELYAVYVPNNEESEVTIPNMAGSPGMVGAPFAFGGTSRGGPSFSFTRQKYSFS